MQNKETPVYVQMKEFYLGTRIYEGKYSLEKKFLDIDETHHIKSFHLCLTPLKIKPIGQILINHGLGGHGSRYIETAIRFADKGIITYMHDFRGFGHSGNGHHFTSLKELLEDVVINFQMIRNDLPLFLFGHSMGGGTCLQFLRKNANLKIAGVILHNPAIKISKSIEITGFERFILKYCPSVADMLVFTGKNVSPHCLFKSEKAFKDFFYHDHLFEMKTTLRMGKVILNMTNAINTKINNNILNYPCLGIIGKRDIVTEPKFFKEYFKNIKCRDFDYIEYEEGLHDCIQDEEGEQICDDIFNWMKIRIKKSPLFKHPKGVDTSVHKKNLHIFKIFSLILVLIVIFFFFK